MATRRTRVYVSGPISNGDQAVNVRNGVLAAAELLDAKFAPYCPHLTHFWQSIHPQKYEDWIALDFEWIPCCDAMLRLPGESPGGDREVALAMKLGIPVYYSLTTLFACVSPEIYDD